MREGEIFRNNPEDIEDIKEAQASSKGENASEREKLYARGERVKAIEAQVKELEQGNFPIELLTQRFDAKMGERKMKSKLGSEQALDMEAEAFLKLMVKRGEFDKFLKNSRFAQGLAGEDPSWGRAASGSDLKFFKKLFGDSENVLLFVNSVGEASKDKDLQFAYATYFDEEEKRMKYVVDHPEVQKKVQEKAKKLGIEYSILYEKVIDNLGKIGEEIDQATEVGQAVAEIIEAYNERRGRMILSELLKKSPRNKWRLHPGVLFGDYQRKPGLERYKDAPDNVEFFGLVPTSRYFLEALTWEDAERINSWVEGRMRFALAYPENQKDLLGLAQRMDSERRAQGQKPEITEILLQLFANLKGELPKS